MIRKEQSRIRRDMDEPEYPQHQAPAPAVAMHAHSGGHFLPAASGAAMEELGRRQQQQQQWQEQQWQKQHRQKQEAAAAMAAMIPTTEVSSVSAPPSPAHHQQQQEYLLHHHHQDPYQALVSAQQGRAPAIAATVRPEDMPRQADVTKAEAALRALAAEPPTRADGAISVVASPLAALRLGRSASSLSSITHSASSSSSDLSFTGEPPAPAPGHHQPQPQPFLSPHHPYHPHHVQQLQAAGPYFHHREQHQQHQLLPPSATPSADMAPPPQHQHEQLPRYHHQPYEHQHQPSLSSSFLLATRDKAGLTAAALAYGTPGPRPLLRTAAAHPGLVAMAVATSSSSLNTAHEYKLQKQQLKHQQKEQLKQQKQQQKQQREQQKQQREQQREQREQQKQQQRQQQKKRPEEDFMAACVLDSLRFATR